MGQFDRIGLKSVGLPGLSDSDRGIGLPERTQPMHVDTRKKPKPAPAGAPPSKNPPKNPPKGPTGPKNPDKYDKGNDRNPKKNGYLDKVKKK